MDNKVKSKDNDMKITVVYICSNPYFAVTMVSAASLIKHTSRENNYEILVLTDGVERADQEDMIALSDSFPNITIRFLNPLKDKKLRKPDDILPVDWFNLALPWILPKYNKVIRLESDTILCSDIAELARREFDDTLYACGIVNNVVSVEKSGKKGTFDTGVLIMCLDRMRSCLSIPLLTQQKNDQTTHFYRVVMQRVFEKHLSRLEPEWCVSVKNVPKGKSMAEVRAAAKIIHYNGEKPWVNPLTFLGEDWWKYARDSAYYEEHIRRMCFQEQPESWIRRLGNKLFPKGSARRIYVKRILRKCRFL